MPSNVKRGVARPLAEHTFPAKLWGLVNNPRNSDVIKWTDDGHGIEIMDNGKFINFLLQDRKNKVFKTKNFASFVRQLNLYGFKKVPARNKPGFQNNPDRSVFFHKYFKKGRKELLSHVFRRAVSKVKGAPLCSTTSSSSSNNLKLGLKFPANGGFSSPYSYISAGQELRAGLPMTLGATPFPNPCIIGLGQVPSYGPAYCMAMNQQRSTNIDDTGTSTGSETSFSRSHSEFRGNTNEDGQSKNFSTNRSDIQSESSISQEKSALENTQTIPDNSPGDTNLRKESSSNITPNNTNIIVSDQTEKGTAKEERICDTQNEVAQSLVNRAVPSSMVGLSVFNENVLYSNPLTSASPSMNLMSWYNFPSYGPVYDYSSIPTPYSPDFGMLPTYNPIMPTTPTDCSPLPSSAIDLRQNVPWFGGLQSSQPPQICTSDGGNNTWMTTVDYVSPDADNVPQCFAPQLPIDATSHGYKNADTFFQTTKTQPAASDIALPESELKVSKIIDVTNADQQRSSENGLVST